ncbi:unnamed protein product [Vicia faba]|uniref:Uncharacterized protein n=1 Tax=Vicia faba TaxID=3906 RepID=A0AAV1AMR7_VICFA|nr:unnamed protein product [Vicia faba]
MFKDGEWIIGGDFNSIKNRSERKGRVEIESNNEMKSFVEFIEESMLVDIPCKGKKFSWYSGDGKSMSRIDRFLLSDNIVNSWEWLGNLLVLGIFQIIVQYGLCWIISIKYQNLSNSTTNGLLLTLSYLLWRRNGKTLRWKEEGTLF